MEILNVNWGTVFWASVAFLIVMFILAKYAWRPILNGLKERQESIEGALAEADKAREEMAKLQSSNEELLREARNERDILLKEARETKDNILREAKEKAKTESDRILTSAKEEIENQKKAAVAELKTQVANLSIEIAERVVKTELADDDKQRTLVNSLLDGAKLN